MVFPSSRSSSGLTAVAYGMTHTYSAGPAGVPQLGVILPLALAQAAALVLTVLLVVAKAHEHVELISKVAPTCGSLAAAE
jgi:hypothetical protein